MGAELHIGVDAEKVVVSPYPIRTRTGRARRRRSGSVTEAVPRPPSGRTRESRVVFAARLALPLLFLCAVLSAAGITWWLPAVASAVALGAVWRGQARAAQPARFAVPASPEAQVLRTAPERAAFVRALEVSRRVRRVWPALPGMIDPVDADRSLTRALGELAALLAQRQELRRLRDELSGVRRADIPADSPALHALDQQRERADELWSSAGAAANRVLRSLEATAAAGEVFVREQQVGETARHAEQTLSRVSGVSPAADTGPELADRTEAVIAAYRELAA